MAALPACLHLSLAPGACRPARATSRRRQVPPTCAAAGLRPQAVAAAPRAQAQGRKADALSPQELHQFDACLRAGDLDGCLGVLQRAAAAGGGAAAATALLGPERNRGLIQACFHARRPDHAVAYCQLLPPNIAPWPAVLKEANRRRDTATLQRVLAARTAAGLAPDQRCTSAAIAGYAAVGRLPDALATFCRAWELPGCRTVEVANSAISACADQANWHAAQEVRGGIVCCGPARP